MSRLFPMDPKVMTEMYSLLRKLMPELKDHSDKQLGARSFQLDMLRIMSSLDDRIRHLECDVDHGHCRICGNPRSNLPPYEGENPFNNPSSCITNDKFVSNTMRVCSKNDNVLCVLHMRCPKCDLLDIVPDFKAKKWKCPRCSVE